MQVKAASANNSWRVFDEEKVLFFFAASDVLSGVNDRMQLTGLSIEDLITHRALSLEKAAATPAIRYS